MADEPRRYLHTILAVLTDHRHRGPKCSNLTFNILGRKLSRLIVRIAEAAVAAKAEELVVVPDGIEPLQATMLKINPLTAWRLLHLIRSAKNTARPTITRRQNRP